MKDDTKHLDTGGGFERSLLEMAQRERERVYGPERIPNDGIATLERYRDHGVPTGDTYRAILANDLFDAFKRADIETAGAMAAIVSWIYNHMPVNAYGSRERVDAWIKMHREQKARELENDITGIPITRPSNTCMFCSKPITEFGDDYTVTNSDNEPIGHAHRVCAEQNTRSR